MQLTERLPYWANVLSLILLFVITMLLVVIINKI
jgi:hypothetical protein